MRRPEHRPAASAMATGAFVATPADRLS